MKKQARRVSIWLLTLVMTAGMLFPSSAAFAAEETDAAEGTDVAKAFQMQSALELYAAGKISCTSDTLTIEESKEGKGLLVTGKPEDLSGAYFTIDEDFDFGEAKVSKVRVDAVAQLKTDMSLDFYLDSGKTPFSSITLKKQKGSNSWDWTGDAAQDVQEQNIQGAHSISLQVKTDSTAKKVSVLLRGFEFMMDDKLPAVYIDIDESIQSIAAMNGDDEHNTECYGNMTLTVPAGYQSEYSDKAFAETTSTTYEMDYIRGRGNSTWMADKRPYKIKLAKKADLLGMGKNKHWVLLANRYDNSLLRNKITYWMGEKLGMPFTPQCEFVDVFMNGEYLGCYYLCEQIRVGESRVEINDLEDDSTPGDGTTATQEPEITGGYLLGISPYPDDWKNYPEQMFSTSRGKRFSIESPEFDNHTPEAQQAQYNYIKDYVQKTEDAIYGEGFKDEDGVSWEEYLDKESTFQYYWMQEVSMNGDAFASTSTYMYKPRGGKLCFGPIWDFDYVAWGDLMYDDPPQIDGFSQAGNFWFQRMLKNEDFAAELQAAYEPVSAVLEEAWTSQIDKYADKIRVADFYEREKWGPYLEYYEEDEPPQASFQDEIDLLKKWMQMRDEWVKANLSELKTGVFTIKFKDGGKIIATETADIGERLENIPAPKPRTGKVFAGWYVNNYGSIEPVDLRYPISEDMTVFAKWIDASKEVKTRGVYFMADNMAIDADLDYLQQEPEVFPAQIVPFNATQQDLKWTCSDQSILKLDAKTGLYMPQKAGTVTVTATTANGKKATCTVTIRDFNDETTTYNYELKKEKIVAYSGDYGKIQFDSSDDPVPIAASFIYEDSKVLEMGECGVFKALKPGKVKFTCERGFGGDEPLACTVTVKYKEKKGTIVTSGGLKYVITKPWTKKAKYGSLKVKGFAKAAKKKLTIPASIKINGHTYRVTAIAASAFKGKKALRSVTFGKNIRTIGAKAFYSCKNLKTITFTGTKIKAIGKNAFRGIAKKTQFTIPKAGLKSYKKVLKKRIGITGKMTVRVKKISYSKM